MRSVRTMLGVATLLGLAGPVVAGQLEDAEAAYRHQDYATALRLIRPLAEGGDARSQAVLGTMYFWGQGGLPQDPVLSSMWYRKAADQGDPYGQMNLGSAYEMGWGVPKDEALAYMWFNLSAASGNEVSKNELRHLEEKMSRSQVQEAQRLTRAWHRSP
jgi:uncharacterized protein